ncbi:hypothetical protein HD806DRAFT_543120 [Xylariaceae sp. AK1471]|nr:hypothetical protein HD806DRAFT_543120 [Xylariaceae sp. AK1471]
MSTNTRGINLSDLRYSISQTRSNFTRLRGHSRQLGQDEQQADFITLIYLIYETYRLSGDQLAPIQQFHPSREQRYNQGHTSTISHIEFPRDDASTARGKDIVPPEYLIVKRPRQSILETQSSALVSFITELRIRTHEPLRAHQSIAKFRGVGWDFEDEEATIPRPLLLEELAPQGSLDHFWVKWNFVSMTFKSKLDLCRDVAEGLLALHRCGVVYGDVKPDNVLVFPRQDVNNSFKAKLTDFGHSVFEHSRLNTVPAFTPLWCAPEVETAVKMSFSEMKATDSYSYGLVVLSIMVARVFHIDLQDVKEHKQNDTLLGEAINLVEKEDRENNNSNFDIGIIRSLLERTVRLEPKYRSLRSCLAVMKKYDVIHGHENGYARAFAGYRSEKIPPLKVDEMVSIGYRSLRRCSYQLKAYITTKLTAIAANGKDPRRMAAAWELAVYHFSGFGVPISFTECSMWLSMAMKGGIAAANSFYYVLHQAMDIPVDPSYVNVMFPTAYTPKGATTLIREKKAPFKENQELQVLEMSSGEEEDRPSDDDFEDRNTPDKPFRLLNNVSDIIREGSVEELQKHLRDESALLNGRDFQGNSPLLLAAKSKRKDMLEVLISYDDLDASIANSSGRTVLHFLTEFDEATAQTWVRQLCKRRANIHHEALPSRGESETLSLSSGIRCCSILNAILHGKLGLLRAFLDACHIPENSVPCRICEAGSAFRRIIAICLSVFRADAAELLLAHRETNGASKIDLNQIEVWAGQRLLPLYTIPFNSIAVKAMDFPESFFRAINFGDQYNRMLEQTLNFLLPTTDDIEKVCYRMLQQAVKSDCIHAAQILIRLGEQRGFRQKWLIQKPINESPFIESIRIGSREVFDLVCNEYPNILSTSIAMPCERRGCELLRPPFYSRWTSVLLGRPNEWKNIPHTHKHNCVSSALSTFRRAFHADMFFLDAILKNTQKELVVDSCADILGDSVLNSNFLLAASLSDYAPELWSNRCWLYNYRSSSSKSSILGTAYSHIEIYLWTFHISPTVATSVFAHGSYEQCQFMMKRLLPLRGSVRASKSRLRWMKAKEHSAESAVPDWTRCKLSEVEFSLLVKGNIVGAWSDREMLWSIVQEQIAQGHSASMSDLVFSIRHGNPEALERMLSCGWNAKAFVSRYFNNPLLEIQRLRNKKESQYAKFRRLLEILYPKLPQNEWMGSATHAIVYDQYKKEQDEQDWTEWSARLQKCEDILSIHGVELPLLVTAWQRARNTAIAWASILYISLYAILLPLVLVFGTRSTWTGWSSGEKFAFAYLWSAVAAAVPPPIWLCTRFSRYGHRERIWSWVQFADPPGKYRADLACFWIVSFLIDHVVVLVLVIRFDWRQFQACNHMLENGIIITTCKNYSYLLPLVVGAVELLVSFAIVGIRQVYFDLNDV